MSKLREYIQIFKWWIVSSGVFVKSSSVGATFELEWYPTADSGINTPTPNWPNKPKTLFEHSLFSAFVGADDLISLNVIVAFLSASQCDLASYCAFFTASWNCVKASALNLSLFK